jgi:hypothetical protein
MHNPRNTHQETLKGQDPCLLSAIVLREGPVIVGGWVELQVRLIGGRVIESGGLPDSSAFSCQALERRKPAERRLGLVTPL